MWTDVELEQMRTDQVSLMADWVTVDRKSSVWDEEQQKTVAVWAQIYNGPARVANPHGTPLVTESGEVVVPRTALVTIPWGQSPLEGDRVTVTTARPGVPATVWVQAVEAASIPTACRMACGAL